MIDIRIDVDNNGILRSILAEGHSMSAGKGSNIVCAAVSAQLRSLVRVVETSPDCKSRTAAEKDGYLDLRIDDYGNSEWMRGVTDVMIAGLMETERDYPDDCSIKLIKTS